MSIEKDKTVGQKRMVPCPQCDNKTRHIVVSSADTQDQDDEGAWSNSISYQVIKCLGCDQLSFRKGILDDLDEVETEQLFPGRIAGRKSLRNVHLLPLSVRNVYRETHAAMCNKQPMLAGVGIRMLVEAICKEKKAKGRDLEKRIDDLVATGVLTQSGGAILHKTRLLGNEAAHEARPHSEAVLDAAMEVAEHLLTSVYLLSQIARRLPTK